MKLIFISVKKEKYNQYKIMPNRNKLNNYINTEPDTIKLDPGLKLQQKT